MFTQEQLQRRIQRRKDMRETKYCALHRVGEKVEYLVPPSKNSSAVWKKAMRLSGRDCTKFEEVPTAWIKWWGMEGAYQKQRAASGAFGVMIRKEV